MARIITKELALKIVAKLKASKIPSGRKAHDQYAVKHEGTIIAFISIRRGSDKDLGHDFIPGDLHISPGKAKRLGQCPWKREDYIQEMREQGFIVEEEG